MISDAESIGSEEVSKAFEQFMDINPKVTWSDDYNATIEYSFKNKKYVIFNVNQNSFIAHILYYPDIKNCKIKLKGLLVFDDKIKDKINKDIGD